MRIGSLNKRITLQYKTEVSDGGGGFTSTWVDLETISAAIWPTSATETLKAGQQTMVLTGRIRIRYRTNIRPSYRIKYDDKYYSITSIVNPGMENKWLDLIYKETVA